MKISIGRSSRTYSIFHILMRYDSMFLTTAGREGCKDDGFSRKVTK
jgi:hypothetical protein